MRKTRQHGWNSLLVTSTHSPLSHLVAVVSWFSPIAELDLGATALAAKVNIRMFSNVASLPHYGLPVPIITERTGRQI